MDPIIYVAVIPGLVAASAVLLLSVRAGKAPPRWRLAWVTGLVLVGLSLAFHLLLIVTSGLHGGFLSVLPIVLGTLAIALTFVAAFWRPIWAGWAFIATAFALPAALWLGITVLPPTSTDYIPAEGLAMTYGVPSLIMGLFLVLSSSQKKATAMESAESLRV